MAPPKISFVIINHNYGRYIDQAISSVLSQTYTDFECHVIDNNSNDESRDVIATFENTDSRLHCEYLDSNLHQMGAFLHVLDRLTGELVCIVDADDFLFANFASFHVQLHLDFSSIAVTSSGVIEVDGAGRSLSPSFASFLNRKIGAPASPANSVPADAILQRHQRELLWRQSTIIAPHELGWHWSPGSANMYKRPYLTRTRPSLKIVNDASTDNYFMPFTHALGGSACIDLPLSGYRIHGNNLHGALPSIPGLKTIRKAAALRSQTRRNDIIRELAARARDFVATHRHTFWALMNAANAGIPRKTYFRDPAIQEILIDHFDELVAACGESQTNNALRARMGWKGHKMFAARQRQRNAGPKNGTD